MTCIHHGPVGALAVIGEMPRHLMDERQIHRLDSQIAPEQIERRGPSKHAPAPDRARDQRGRTIVESCQHLRVLGAAVALR